MEEPLPVLRRTLAAANNHSVSYVSVGFLNNLAELLASPPDTISPLTGQQLVEQKVSESHQASVHHALYPHGAGGPGGCDGRGLPLQ